MAKTQIGSLIKNAQKKMKLTNFKVLENKYVLYLVLFLAIFDLMIFMIAGEISFIVIFILTGLITSYFSKNMIVIMLISLVLTNFVMATRNGLHEGMNDKTTNDAEKAVKDAEKALKNAKTSEEKKKSRKSIERRERRKKCFE